MHFLEILEGKQSKAKVLKAVFYIGDSPDKFSEFMDAFILSEGRECQKMSWVIGTIVDTQPDLIALHATSLLEKLKTPCHAAVKRNVLRAIDRITIDESQMGLAADIAFKVLEDIRETIAVRVFAMSILHRICMLQPELAPELISILEFQMPYESPGFKSRAKKIIKSLTNFRDI